jgi:hypothetical protein
MQNDVHRRDQIAPDSGDPRKIFGTKQFTGRGIQWHSRR